MVAIWSMARRMSEHRLVELVDNLLAVLTANLVVPLVSGGVPFRPGRLLGVVNLAASGAKAHCITLG